MYLFICFLSSLLVLTSHESKNLNLIAAFSKHLGQCLYTGGLEKDVPNGIQKQSEPPGSTMCEMGRVTYLSSVYSSHSEMT